MKTIELTSENICKIFELARLFALECIKTGNNGEIAGYPNELIRNQWYEDRAEFINKNWNNVEKNW